LIPRNGKSGVRTTQYVLRVGGINPERVLINRFVPKTQAGIHRGKCFATINRFGGFHIGEIQRFVVGWFDWFRILNPVKDREKDPRPTATN
jgi:hypothetical protein